MTETKEEIREEVKALGGDLEATVKYCMWKCCEVEARKVFKGNFRGGSNEITLNEALEVISSSIDGDYIAVSPTTTTTLSGTSYDVVARQLVEVLLRIGEPDQLRRWGLTLVEHAEQSEKPSKGVLGFLDRLVIRWLSSGG